MDFLANLCDWWWLAWLLPFILGLLLGWAIWSKYKSQVEDLEKDIGDLNANLKGVEEDLAACKSRSADLDGQISILRGRIREAEYQKSKLEEELKSAANLAVGAKLTSEKKTGSKSASTSAADKKQKTKSKAKKEKPKSKSKASDAVKAAAVTGLAAGTKKAAEKKKTTTARKTAAKKAAPAAKKAATTRKTASTAKKAATGTAKKTTAATKTTAKKATTTAKKNNDYD